MRKLAGTKNTKEENPAASLCFLGKRGQCNWVTE